MFPSCNVWTFCKFLCFTQEISKKERTFIYLLYFTHSITINVSVVHMPRGRNDFDAGKSISRTRGMSLENRDFSGPRKVEIITVYESSEFYYHFRYWFNVIFFCLVLLYQSLSRKILIEANKNSKEIFSSVGEI
jgi:hypothetical protein